MFQPGIEPRPLRALLLNAESRPTLCPSFTMADDNPGLPDSSELTIKEGREFNTLNYDREKGRFSLVLTFT